VAINYFNEILGALLVRSNNIDLETLELNRFDLTDLGGRFIEEEVWGVIQSLPPDKALGLDGFMSHFL
jgi:hypothetical protein